MFSLCNIFKDALYEIFKISLCKIFKVALCKVFKIAPRKFVSRNTALYKEDWTLERKLLRDFSILRHFGQEEAGI